MALVPSFVVSSPCFLHAKRKELCLGNSLASVGGKQLDHLYWPGSAESEVPQPREDGADFLGDRRDALNAIGLLSFAGAYPKAATGVGLTRRHENPDGNVLSDLPPIPTDCVRLFLCRHGQTEYNRLKLVQGSRTDAEINENGVRQAQLLGNALSHATPSPDVIFHSSLSRAKQTAALSAQQFPSSIHAPTLKVLPDLGEIDFGGVEGVSVDEVRAKMVAIYSTWAVGNIDTRMARDGESFREILLRVKNALGTLINSAQSSESRCVAAVTHSTYLRILLAVIQDIPLAQASTMEQKNACINVIDFSFKDNTALTKKLVPNSNLFGGALSHAPQNFSIEIPVGMVLRTGEKRHLGSLAI